MMNKKSDQILPDLRRLFLEGRINLDQLLQLCSEQRTALVAMQDALDQYQVISETLQSDIQVRDRHIALLKRQREHQAV